MISTRHWIAIVLTVAPTGLTPALAQDPASPADFPPTTKEYSPNLDQRYPNHVYWGDTHGR